MRIVIELNFSKLFKGNQRHPTENISQKQLCSQRKSKQAKIGDTKKI